MTLVESLEHIDGPSMATKIAGPIVLFQGKRYGNNSQNRINIEGRSWGASPGRKRKNIIYTNNLADR